MSYLQHFEGPSSGFPGSSAGEACRKLCPSCLMQNPFEERDSEASNQRVSISITGRAKYLRMVYFRLAAPHSIYSTK